MNFPYRRYACARYAGSMRTCAATSSRTSLRLASCFDCISLTMRLRALDIHCTVRRLAFVMSLMAMASASASAAWCSAHCASSTPACSRVRNAGLIDSTACCRRMAASDASILSMTCRTSPVRIGRSFPNSRR